MSEPTAWSLWRFIAFGLMGVVLSAAAAPFGRLFTTPEERARLDALRRPPSDQAAVAAAVPAVEKLALDGIVVRSSGNNAAWINGSPIFAGEANREGVRVEATTADGVVGARLLHGHEAIRLEAGQTFDATTGRVLEGFEVEAQQEAESGFATAAKR